MGLFGCLAAAEELERWQQCDVFLARHNNNSSSSLTSGSWGVFAARKFAKNEIVELSPLFVPLDSQAAVIRDTALADYVYSYEGGSVAVLGNGMLINRHSSVDASNVKFTLLRNDLGSASGLKVMKIAAFVATRDIEAGEELCSVQEDNDRTSSTPALEQAGVINETELSLAKTIYCPRVYGGIGLLAWEERPFSKDSPDASFYMAAGRLGPRNGGLHGAFAKRKVQAGAIVESAPVLILPKDRVFLTSLSPLSFYWNDLLPNHRDGLSGNGNTVFFPAAGHIAMVSRVGDHNPNCRLEIHPFGGLEEGNAGVVFDLIATQDIQPGQILRLNLPEAKDYEAVDLLLSALMETGQPLPPLEMPWKSDEL